MAATLSDRPLVPARPPYDIVRVAHVELAVAELERSVAFYEDLLGLIVTERRPGGCYLRGWEERLHHCVALREGPLPATAHIGLRVREPRDLALLADELESRGRPLRWVDDEPGQGQALRVQDELGFPIEFFCEMAGVAPSLQAFHLQRGAPIMRLDHVNIHVPDVERAVEVYLGHGFRCSEYIATDDERDRMVGAWMLRKSTVHDVAMTLGRGPRLHHLAFWVADAAAVLRACDQLAAAGHAHAIERGPGRHGVSNAFFVYFRDPDGHRIELYTGDYYTGDPDLRPLRWSVDDPSCRSFYGTRAPDSWYDESSVVLDLDGEPVPVVETVADERTELLS